MGRIITDMGIVSEVRRGHKELDVALKEFKTLKGTQVKKALDEAKNGEYAEFDAVFRELEILLTFGHEYLKLMGEHPQLRNFVAKLPEEHELKGKMGQMSQSLVVVAKKINDLAQQLPG